MTKANRKTPDVVSKLHKVNVPELFFQTYMTGKQYSKSRIVKRLQSIKPVKRGAGYTRIIPEITLAEWEDLYKMASDKRATIVGAGARAKARSVAEGRTVSRREELIPALCAKAMAGRMEKEGVKKPISYGEDRKHPKTEDELVAIAKNGKAKKARPAPRHTAKVTSIKMNEVRGRDAVGDHLFKIPNDPVTILTADGVDITRSSELFVFKRDLQIG